MRIYECKGKCGEIIHTKRLDVIGEPTFFQSIKLFFGGTIKLNGWRVKKL